MVDDSTAFSVFVGDLAPDVNDFLLQESFRQFYASVRSAKVRGIKTGTGVLAAACCFSHDASLAGSAVWNRLCMPFGCYKAVGMTLMCTCERSGWPSVVCNQPSDSLAIASFWVDCAATCWQAYPPLWREWWGEGEQRMQSPMLHV